MEIQRNVLIHMMTGPYYSPPTMYVGKIEEPLPDKIDVGPALGGCVKDYSPSHPVPPPFLPSLKAAPLHCSARQNIAHIPQLKDAMACHTISTKHNTHRNAHISTHKHVCTHMHTYLY